MNVDNIKIFDDNYNLLYDILDKAHPVGSLYWSKILVNPNELFVGVWERITEGFVFAAGDEDPVDDVVRGSDTVTLGVNNLPKHTHGLNKHSHAITGSISKTERSGIGPDEKEGRNLGCSGYVDIVAPYRKDGSGFEVNDYQKASINVSHSHEATTSTGASTVANTDDGGFSNESFSIIPRYLNRYCWKRIS